MEQEQQKVNKVVRPVMGLTVQLTPKRVAIHSDIDTSSVTQRLTVQLDTL